MTVGFGINLITFTPNTTARSGDVNTNFSALNQAENYNFSTCQIDPAITPDSSFRGLKMLTATDLGILNDTNLNWFRIASGMTTSSKIVFTDRSNNQVFGFWTDGTYDYIDCGDSYFRVRTGVGNSGSGGNNSLRLASSNAFNISGNNYGFITAGSAVFNQGTGNADIAEPLLTRGDVKPGMAVCIIDQETVAPCTHEACKVARIVSTAPVICLSPRVQDDEHFSPIPGHESAMPIVIGGIAPVLILPGSTVKLRDRITPSGSPGFCKVARDDEYALGDIIKIEKDVVYAWIHY